MNKSSKKLSLSLLGLVTTACVLGMVLPPGASAQVSEADFNALKEMVQKLSGQMKDLQQTNNLIQQAHESDLRQIQQLQEKLAATQQVATNAERISIEASQAQSLPRQPIDEATVNHNFSMVGDAEVQFVKASGQNGAFLLADFAPIFLYRAGDNILFEAGFDTTLQNNAPGSPGATTSFDLSFAQLDWVMNDYATFSAGYLLLPLGTYAQRNAGWLNKFPDTPLAIDALLPSAGAGVMLSSGIPVGESGATVGYSIYGVNGPSSSDGTANAGALDLGGNVGTTSDGANANLHTSPSGGGRLSYFMPIPYKPHYDFELGISGQSGPWDNAGNFNWTAGSLDASIHLGPNIELKGQFIETQYGSNQGLIRQQGWYVQGGYKLAGLNLEIPCINNVEVVGRYDTLLNGSNYDPGAGTTTFYNTRRTTVGFIYYFTSTMLLEGDYEFFESSDPGQFSNQMILQLSVGF